ncbi:protein OPI10 homolog [Dysidea avara]|uniref:protein OPI10 homolog n=1 Tax=Dysidea avara TaxID=196820 RepID=UPI0033283360
MFGIVASGRLINTDVQQASENQFFLALEQAESVGHVVVFLTGGVPFNPGFAGAIYFGWPTPEGGITWQYLGYISNEKPSAIFKLAKVKQSDVTSNPFAGSTFGAIAQTTALVGICVESVNEIVAKTPAADTVPSTVASYNEFCTKMLQNFYNYAASFAVGQMDIAMTVSQTGGNPSQNYVPIQTLTNWYESFSKRLAANPNFWKT